MTLLSYKQKNWAHIRRFLNNLYNFCYLSKGSSSFADADADPPIFIIDLQDANKKLI